MKLSNSLKKRFCKDFSLPIGLFDDEYFYYFINEYDSLLNTKSKLRLLEDTVRTLGGEEQFMQEFNRIRDAIIADVSESDGYCKLSSDTNPRPYNAVREYSGQNIYCPQFSGKQFISIDIRKANFFSMKTYDSSILNEASTWNEFLKKYTSLEYYHQSKQLRQVIFGNLLPKRQQAIQKSVCKEIADIIKQYMKVNVAIVSTDEILILDHPNPSEGVLDVSGILERRLGYITADLRLEAFELEQIHHEKPYFVKKNLKTGDITFKSVPQVFFAQVFKNYVRVPLTEYDLSFFYEGMIAKFNQNIYEEKNI